MWEFQKRVDCRELNMLELNAPLYPPASLPPFLRGLLMGLFNYRYRQLYYAAAAPIRPEGRG